MKTIKTHGRTFTGTVTSNKMTKTVSVEWGRRHYIPKYERYEKRKTVVKAHTDIELEVGDVVVIKETRPLSKTKHFVVIRKATAKEKQSGEVTVKKDNLVEEVPSEEKTVEKKAVVKKSTKKTTTKKVEAEKPTKVVKKE